MCYCNACQRKEYFTSPRSHGAYIYYSWEKFQRSVRWFYSEKLVLDGFFLFVLRISFVIWINLWRKKLQVILCRAQPFILLTSSCTCKIVSCCARSLQETVLQFVQETLKMVSICRKHDERFYLDDIINFFYNILTVYFRKMAKNKM